MGRLILVPTPLGNLGDITLRALEQLKSADIVLAEDTRTTQKLLSHYGIQAKLRSFHLHNEHKVLDESVRLIASHNEVVLVSDAGTPGISDPGFLLVRACHEADIPVECLPGPVALIPALVKSGFPSDRFIFEGFLPHKKGRQSRIQALINEHRTVVFYESPHRLLKTLQQCAEILGKERKAAVVREISKLHEELHSGSLDQLIFYFTKTTPRGEIVLLIHPVEDLLVMEEADNQVDAAELFLRGPAKRKKA